MRRLKVQRSGLLCAAVLIGLYMWAGQAGLPVEAAELSTAVFYVLWYDVGKTALERLDGVKRVQNGFRGSKEINTVDYEPARVTIAAMEAALKQAGTYRGTVGRPGE